MLLVCLIRLSAIGLDLLNGLYTCVCICSSCFTELLTETIWTGFVAPVETREIIIHSQLIKELKAWFPRDRQNWLLHSLGVL